ncbi:forkhead box protein R1 isoform X2 [Lacerta agilis]|uniref:forkhead box protein R1 isoform X2 n=1 Tax=Lacerta agilis TaxID=80427 RepID=UPI00141A230A|nr:forkhead box protein R1 isoform X2 [Lacerta agilis]
MALLLQKPAFWANLHLCSGLWDWNMRQELGLSTICEELPHAPADITSAGGLMWPSERLATGSLTRVLHPPAPESDPQPHPWMWVNPNLACCIPGHVSVVVPLPSSCPATREVPQEDDTSQLSQKTRGTRRSTWAPWKAKVLRSHARKLKRTLGDWPRPPLNYCILISLALSSSVSSSLTVQEIYQFIRKHFPFFRTAPEGWKNTIRHNLCFSSSFEKTAAFVCLDGNRKSRMWKLTTEGWRKFRAETQELPEDLVRLMRQSMDKPELMRSLFGLGSSLNLDGMEETPLQPSVHSPVCIKESATC